MRRRRQSQGAEGRKGLGGRGDKEGKRGTDQVLWWNKSEALRASRKNGNRQPQEVEWGGLGGGGWGFKNIPEIWKVRDAQDSKGP